jgi:hypothetical protein
MHPLHTHCTACSAMVSAGSSSASSRQVLSPVCHLCLLRCGGSAATESWSSENAGGTAATLCLSTGAVTTNGQLQILHEGLVPDAMVRGKFITWCVRRVQEGNSNDLGERRSWHLGKLSSCVTMFSCMSAEWCVSRVESSHGCEW